MSEYTKGHVSVAIPNDGGPAVVLPDPCHDPRNGFTVEIIIHTDEARKQLTDPETVRHRIGFGLEANSELEEEIDYTITVRRAQMDTKVGTVAPSTAAK